MWINMLGLEVPKHYKKRRNKLPETDSLSNGLSKEERWKEMQGIYRKVYIGFPEENIYLCNIKQFFILVKYYGPELAGE